MTTNHTTVPEVRTGTLEQATPVFSQTRPVEYHAIGSLTIAAGGAGANYACPGTGTKYDIKGLKLQLSFAAVGNNMVGGDALTVYFYQLREGTYYLLDTKAVTTLATAAGSVTKVEVPCDFADTTELHGATHFAVAGNVAVAAGGATGSTVYVDYDLFADEDVALEFSGTIGSVTVAAIGATTDAPVADTTTVEDGTARTGISLWKRAVNMLIAFLGKFSAANTARTTATSVLPVQVIDALGNVVGASAGMPFNPTHHSPDDFTAARTDDDTIALAAGPVTFTSANTLIAYITKKSAANAVTTYINGTGGVSLYIGADNTLEMVGASVAATDTIISVGLRVFDKENNKTINSKNVLENDPLDTRDTTLAAISSNVTVTKNTTKYFPANSVTIDSCWDTFSLNASGGKAQRISFTGILSTGALSTPYLRLYATDDPNATIASKRWVQVAFINDMTGSTVTQIDFAANTASQLFLCSVAVPFDKRYLILAVSEDDNQQDVTGLYIDGSAGW